MTAPCLLSKNIKTPEYDTKQALKLEFSEPMDYWMIHKNAKINHPGNWTTKTDGKKWQFIPTKKWQNKEYNLDLSYGITDLADHKLSTDNNCINQQTF
jgi:hypothetical protein